MVGWLVGCGAVMAAQDGKTWKKRNLQVHDDNEPQHTLAVQLAAATHDTAGKGVEYSYPTVLQTPNKDIHVAYTYDRKCIKYRRLTEAWITAAFAFEE